jgi:hypothetical protein
MSVLILKQEREGARRGTNAQFSKASYQGSNGV